MNQKLHFPSSPVAETARQILEKCSELRYPPEEWKLPDNEGSRHDPGAFSSVWKRITGHEQAASANALPFSWNPDELHARSSEFLAIHKTVLLKQLEPRHGTAAEIDLFGWFWKGLIEDYVNFVAGLTMPTELDGNDVAYVARDGAYVTESERKQQAVYDLDVETKTAWDFILKPSTDEKFRHAIRNFESKRNIFDDAHQQSGQKLGFTQAFCKRSAQNSRSQSLSDNALSKISSNEALKLRLLFWWGWPEAPFMCMQRMIKEHTEHMVDEGYLRLKSKATPHTPAGYILTDAGLKRLKELDPDGKIGLFDYIRLNDLVGLGANLSSLCQLLFPR